MNSSGKQIKKQFTVTGMTCSGCERTVQRVIANLDGVTDARASHTTSSVTVEYDPDKIETSKIREAVEKVGYKFAGEAS